MQNWIYFVLIAQGIWSVTSMIDKFVISKGYIKNPLVYIVLNGLMGFLVVLFVPFIKITPLGIFNFLVLLISGSFFTAAIISYYKAVQYDEISRISMMAQFGPIIVLILSFFILGEKPSQNSVIGFTLLLFAGIIVSYRKVDKKFQISPALFYMLLSALLGGISFIAARRIASITNFWNAFFWFRVSGLTAFAVLLLPSVRKEFAQSYKAATNWARGLLGFKIMIDFLAFMFSNYALSIVPAVALMSALNASSQPLIIFILASLASIYLPSFIHEKIDRKALITKLIAIIFIFAGIIFINIG